MLNFFFFKKSFQTYQGSFFQFSSKFTQNAKIKHLNSKTVQTATIKPNLTHVDSTGKAKMVDISHKAPSFRCATAQGRVQLNKEAFKLVCENKMSKGDVLQVSRIAGIMGSKKTSELIPLCHQVPLTQVKVDLALDDANKSVVITVKASTLHNTGVEMEALTGVSTCALTIYDMCKSAGQQGMVVKDIKVVNKKGGKQGEVSFNN